MKKMFLAALLIGGLLLAGCLGGSQATPVPTEVPVEVATATPAPVATEVVTPVETPTPVVQAYVDTDNVSIVNGVFTPQYIKVAAGTKVTWENQDGVIHSVKSDASSPASFYSGNIPGRGLYRYTFDTPGTYDYYDDLGSKGTGTVQVE